MSRCYVATTGSAAAPRHHWDARRWRRPRGAGGPVGSCTCRAVRRSSTPPSRQAAQHDRGPVAVTRRLDPQTPHADQPLDEGTGGVQGGDPGDGHHPHDPVEEPGSQPEHPTDHRVLLHVPLRDGDRHHGGKQQGVHPPGRAAEDREDQERDRRPSRVTPGSAVRWSRDQRTVLRSSTGMSGAEPAGGVAGGA